MTMRAPIAKKAWKLLSLLVFIHWGQSAGDKAEDYQENGQAYFFDGTVGCSGNGYGITVDEFYMECDHQNADYLCLFDEYFKIMGQITTQAQIPQAVQVIPRICRRNGYSCSSPLVRYSYVNLCNYLEGGNCAAASAYTFDTQLYMPTTDITSNLFEWAEERQQDLDETMDYLYDDDAQGKAGKVSAKVLLQVEFRPVQSLSIFERLVYYGEEMSGYANYDCNEDGCNDDAGYQQQQAQQAQEYQYNNNNYGGYQSQSNQAYQEYMNEPTKSIYCQIPFRLVANDYNITGSKHRSSYLRYWWYQLFNNMLSDCTSWDCDLDTTDFNEEEQTYYYIGTVSSVGLMGGLLGLFRKRRMVTNMGADEGLVEDPIGAVELKVPTIPTTLKEAIAAVEGDEYVTMS